MNKIVLFGTGNLGKRYIQAIARLNGISLYLSDISNEALNSAVGFISANNLEGLKYYLTNSIEDAISVIDKETLVIVASTATKRADLLSRIILRTPKGIICEKPVTQNREDYLKIIELLQKHDVKTYVDFTLRMQPFYQKVKSEILKQSNGVFFANLPRMGLACVGIHQIDLFMWLFNLKSCELRSSTFTEVYEQKRAGFYDIIGSLEISSSGFQGVIINSETENIRSAQIILNESTYNIFEDQRILSKINKVEPELNYSETISYSFVSQYMSDIISDIFSDKIESIELPSIESSFPQHKVLFDYLSKHSLINLNFT